MIHSCQRSNIWFRILLSRCDKRWNHYKQNRRTRILATRRKQEHQQSQNRITLNDKHKHHTCFKTFRKHLYASRYQNRNNPLAHWHLHRQWQKAINHKIKHSKQNETMKKLYTIPTVTRLDFNTEGVIATSSIPVNNIGTDAEVLNHKRSPWNAEAWENNQ